MSDEPAFPLTKREWYAGLAMQGTIIAMQNAHGGLPHLRATAENAVAYADALLAALKEKP